MKNWLLKIKQQIAKMRKVDSSENTIFRNMAKLATGISIARILGLLTAPIITRIYLPEHMGVLSVFTALASLLVPIATLRYTTAIPLPKHDGTAANLTFISGFFLLVLTVLTFIILLFFGTTLLRAISMEQLLPYWWLLPIAIAGIGLYEILNNWAIRERAFKPLAKTKVWQKLLGSSVKIGLGLLGFKPLGLLVGQIVTQSGGIVSLFSSFKKKIIENIKHINYYRIKFLMKRYVDFPKYRLPSQFLLVLSTKAPLLFFAWQYGPETTGQLGLALMMLALPIEIIGQTTSQAYYAEIARLGPRNVEKIRNITLNVCKKLFFFSLAPFIVLYTLGPKIFAITFGDTWYEAGKYASLLSIYLLSGFVTSPIMNVFNVLEKQSIFFLLNMIRSIILLVVFFYAYKYNLTSYTTTIVYSSSMFLFHIITGIVAYISMNTNFSNR